MMTKNPTLFYHLYDTLEDTNQHSDSKRLGDRLRNNRSGSKTGVERQDWRAHGKNIDGDVYYLDGSDSSQVCIRIKGYQTIQCQNVCQESCFHED